MTNRFQDSCFSFWQLFVQKHPCVPRRKFIDLTKTQEATVFIKLGGARIECIKVEADTLPRSGFLLGLLQQPAADAPPAPVSFDPEMTDVTPLPMGDTIETADERVIVINEN